jgi:hypothetical protein
MNLEIFGWTPTIGDPTIYGWLTVAAYAVGAFVCWRAAASAPAPERRFWIVLTAVMAFLCINKQLDLQTLFTDAGRVEAKLHGWYARRREYQVGFIEGLAVAFAIVIAIGLFRARSARTPVRGALLGLALLLFFVMVRASSFHRMDWLISREFAGVRANHLMELGGIAIVTFFAWSAARPAGRR